MKLVCRKCGSHDFYILKETVAKTYLNIKYSKKKITIDNFGDPFDFYESIFLDCAKCQERYLYDTKESFNEGEMDLTLEGLRECRLLDTSN